MTITGGGDGVWSRYLLFHVDPGRDYIVSWWQVCYPDYYVEWPVSSGEIQTWYHIFHTDDGGQPGRPSQHEGLALEAQLSVDIPAGSDDSNSVGAHTKAALTNIAEIQVKQPAGGGHRRFLQMNLGGLQTAQTCDMTTVQSRATRIDQRCCATKDECPNGIPLACSLNCAMYFVPL